MAPVLLPNHGQSGSNSRLVLTGVGVEKLILGELAENSSRQDALQAIFSDRVDIFYRRI
jgi:hypothetical protein